MLPLTRTAALADYPECASVAQWQQELAEDACWRWMESRADDAATKAAEVTLCLNWGAARFRAPGDNPIYFSYLDMIPPVPPLQSEHGPCDCGSCDTVSAVYALSVLDRVDAPLRFLRQMLARLSHGGLLVCTFAAWDATGEDCAVGHELRRRIYDRYSWGELVKQARGLGLPPFGGVDLRYHGNTLGDHTLASLVLTVDWRERCTP